MNLEEQIKSSKTEIARRKQFKDKYSYWDHIPLENDIAIMQVLLDFSKGIETDENRPVEFKLDSTTNPLLKGRFIKWGSGVIEEHQGSFQYSVGIIEGEDGKVHEITPDYIKFTDKKYES